MSRTRKDFGRDFRIRDRVFRRNTMGYEKNDYYDYDYDFPEDRREEDDEGEDEGEDDEDGEDEMD